ncbi:MAG: RbsD/FucU domain-containing protein [Verrucomicrobiota bacterium]
MLKTGILNPRVLDLLARIRHTNTLVIADRGLPVLATDRDRGHFAGGRCADGAASVGRGARSIVIGKAWMAQEFLKANDRKTQAAFATVLKGVQLTH